MPVFCCADTGEQSRSVPMGTETIEKAGPLPRAIDTTSKQEARTEKALELLSVFDIPQC
jgi:hypothetical protein